MSGDEATGAPAGVEEAATATAAPTAPTAPAATGDPAADAALDRLRDLDDLAPEEHAGVFRDVAQRLADALEDTGAVPDDRA